ncbi:uncharacterized protein LOC112202633 [Rosa chinensis]|uniref:uncharacterized protein LOC112202633 n=1 Tax=Rosa chinensis TaxID=74649 RepID=UPI001AD8BD3F|nr:uncharacterized protein LOC112202633 [Rosa chinensis]
MQDVYGCIKSLIPEHQVTVKDTGKLESKCEIFVENLRREDIRITFWGDIAREFDMERVKQLSPPVLAVFTGLRLTKFQERVTAATTGHTCIMINPDIPIANEYKWGTRSILVYTDKDIDEIQAEWAKHVLKFLEN